MSDLYLASRHFKPNAIPKEILNSALFANIQGSELLELAI